MAHVDLQITDGEPVAAGNPGTIKVISFVLAAATPKNIYFGKHKLLDPDNAVVTQSDAHTNGAGESIDGTALSTVPVIHSSGEYITCTDSAGGKFTMLIAGLWGGK